MESREIERSQDQVSRTKFCGISERITEKNLGGILKDISEGTPNRIPEEHPRAIPEGGILEKG